MNSVKTLLLACLATFVFSLVTATASAAPPAAKRNWQNDHDAYWRNHWGWYDRSYRPYYHRHYHYNNYNNGYYNNGGYGAYYNGAYPRGGVQLGPLSVWY